MADDLARLTEIFRTLGAQDPEGWARSQLEEGIPQLARFLFLRRAWSGVVAEGDARWIEAQIAAAERRPNDPGAGAGAALKRLLATGANAADLSEVIRVAQWELLHHLCYLLSDPQGAPPAHEGVSWSLMQLDAEGRPTVEIGGLHESVLETDPSGREMRPRKA